jgi:uncharacterized DUF497 family protein
MDQPMADRFEWDDGNRSEIADHGVNEVECEQAFADPNRITRRTASDRGEPRAGIIGVTKAGRLVVVIFTRRDERFRVVTAWPASRGPDARAYREANQ